MAKVSLSKSSLSQQSQQLKSYQQFLPSLDMKRKQLMGERARELAERRALEARLEALKQRVAERLPMLANEEINLDTLVQVEQVELGRENRMGTWLPTLAELRIAVRPYGYLSKPHWIEPLIDSLREALRLRLQLRLAEQRLALLDQAVRTVTQRVNLFDKVLIPRTRANIKRIRIALSDAERAAVVRSKIAKKKRAAEGLG
ncbi:V-type ATP synthase subunit D [Halochromatium roseum]|uniref:V-type ATP synthase subunit D n=1 Tax=Halochromatium roseum TaxID=391920 RepID=UPI0019143DB5|nr:V-type ATP synthase subunit D [Halochromatium roseum]MBK5938597.1 V-type ATP synthase subunit D [Halochromatium roseum]